MITAQSEGLEQISLMLRKAAEDTENTTGKIVRLTGEIIDDLQLESISDKTEMMTLLESLCTQTEIMSNRLYGFSKTVCDVETSYSELERKSCAEIDCLSCMIDSLGAEIGYLCSANDVAVEEPSPEDNIQNNTELLVTGSVQELQMTNIAAIGKAIEEKYYISAIGKVGSKDDEDNDSE